MENNTANAMTAQDFYEFQTTVDGSALSYENQPDGTTIITCGDGTKLLITADGNSKPLETDIPAEWSIPEGIVITLADVLPAKNSDAVELDRR